MAGPALGISLWGLLPLDRIYYDLSGYAVRPGHRNRTAYQGRIQSSRVPGPSGSSEIPIYYIIPIVPSWAVGNSENNKNRIVREEYTQARASPSLTQKIKGGISKLLGALDRPYRWLEEKASQAGTGIKGFIVGLGAGAAAGIVSFVSPTAWKETLVAAAEEGVRAGLTFTAPVTGVVPKIEKPKLTSSGAGWMLGGLLTLGLLGKVGARVRISRVAEVEPGPVEAARFRARFGDVIVEGSPTDRVWRVRPKVGGAAKPDYWALQLEAEGEARLVGKRWSLKGPKSVVRTSGRIGEAEFSLKERYEPGKYSVSGLERRPGKTVWYAEDFRVFKSSRSLGYRWRYYVEDPVVQQLITRVKPRAVLEQFKPRVSSVEVELWSVRPVKPWFGLPGLVGLYGPGVRESSGVDLLKASLTPGTLGERTTLKTRSSSILGTVSRTDSALASGSRLVGSSLGGGGERVRDVLRGPSIPLLPPPRAGGRRRKRSRRMYSEIVYPAPRLPF